ncbi:MAG: family 20 glycosylhydrolase [Acidobacteriota bacterium]|nr:family 20 glycosylhydrolase [Acidobacteriota bacterium]
MKRLLLSTSFFLMLASVNFAQSDEINIIPKPSRVTPQTGVFELNSKTKIVAANEAGKRLATILNVILERDFGFKLVVTTKRQKKNAIVLTIENMAGHYRNNEEYGLSVKSGLIQIAGDEPAGFYAIQTLRQLFQPISANSIAVRSAEIHDYPRFPYRGMHLDVGRHFMPVSFVKKYIDLISQYKFNYFHWHLTEDQGWRIEIKKYPKLTEIGSKRPETVKERNLTPYIGDGVPVKGFYTQEEIKDVVAYAKARYITVIPEIELPGHASAALAAYPELGCKENYAYKVQTTWGIFKEVFCPTEKTFQFLEDVLTETIALFPDSPYIHIGGDEVLKDHWKESPFVQELKKKENLKDEHEVQSYFIRRVEKFLNSKSKKMIGWDEILEGGLAPKATVMSWRGMKGGIEAAKSKHDVIMTPTDFAYLNFGQGDPVYEPLSYPDYLPLAKVYSFDPVPKELSADEAKYIIGGQGNLWTEYIKTPETAEYMIFPRMLALSEALWSKPEDKNLADFSKRLTAHFPKLDKQDVNYRIPEPAGLRNMILTGDGKARVELEPAQGTKVYYTLDGTTPDVTAKQYEKPIEMDVKQGESAALKTIVVNANGRKSSIYAATLLRREMLQPVNLTETKPGVHYRLEFPNSDAAQKAAPETGETKSILLTQFTGKDLKKPFSVTFEGYFNAPADGIYEFQIDSTWDAIVLLGGSLLIDSVGTKERQVRSAIAPLKQGLHKMSLGYIHRGGEAAFAFRWGIKGQGLRRAYGSEFVH